MVLAEGGGGARDSAAEIWRYSALAKSLGKGVVICSHHIACSNHASSKWKKGKGTRQERPCRASVANARTTPDGRGGATSCAEGPQRCSSPATNPHAAWATWKLGKEKG